MKQILFNRLGSTVLLSASLVLLGANTAHASQVISCPAASTISFDQTQHQWKTTDSGWTVDAHSYRVITGSPTFSSAKLVIDHKKGDVASCTYKLAPHTDIVLTKTPGTGTSTKLATFSPATVQWDNKRVKNEFICDASSVQGCKFEDENALPNENMSTSGIEDDIRRIEDGQRDAICSKYPDMCQPPVLPPKDGSLCLKDPALCQPYFPPVSNECSLAMGRYMTAVRNYLLNQTPENLQARVDAEVERRQACFSSP